MSFCHKRGIKVYADCTEWYDPKGFSVHTLIKKADTWYRMRYVNKMLDGIIAISRYLQNYYDNSGCRTILVPPLVDLSSEKWKKNIDNVYYSNDIVHLIYVGNPGAGNKDKLGLIVLALKYTKSIHPELVFNLDIIGMNEKEFYDVFKMKLDACNFVNFMGRKPNSDALDYIKRSDYTIFLRDNNLICTAGFPTKFSESLACGTPVLTNISSDLDLYLREGENGFVLKIDSLEQLGEGLYSALSIPKEMRLKMKLICAEERTFDYHSFINEFKTMF